MVVPINQDDGTEDIFDALKKGSIAGVKYWYAENPSSIHRKTRNLDNLTPLHWASSNGNLDIVKFLLSKGVDMEAEDSDYATALEWASYKGHVLVVEALLDKGANINHRDKEKQTPLHYAVGNNKLPTVKILIERGANKNLKSNKNQTPLELAREKRRKSIVNYLSSV